MLGWNQDRKSSRLSPTWPLVAGRAIAPAPSFAGDLLVALDDLFARSGLPPVPTIQLKRLQVSQQVAAPTMRQYGRALLDDVGGCNDTVVADRRAGVACRFIGRGLLGVGYEG